MIKICKTCKKELTIDNFYKSGKNNDGSIYYKPSCKSCYNKNYTYKKRDNIIKLAKELFGYYKCSICGYDKCIRALHFHHIDKSTKDYQISNMYSFSDEKIIQEMKKCIIVCANCHAELHE